MVVVFRVVVAVGACVVCGASAEISGDCGADGVTPQIPQVNLDPQSLERSPQARLVPSGGLRPVPGHGADREVVVSLQPSRYQRDADD